MSYCSLSLAGRAILSRGEHSEIQMHGFSQPLSILDYLPYFAFPFPFHALRLSWRVTHVLFLDLGQAHLSLPHISLHELCCTGASTPFLPCVPFKYLLPFAEMHSFRVVAPAFRFRVDRKDVSRRVTVGIKGTRVAIKLRLK